MIQNLHNPLQWNAQFREPVASEWLTHGTPWNKNQFSFNTWPEAGLGEAPTKTVPAEPDFAICWATLRLKRLLLVCYCLIEVGKWSVTSIDDRLNYETVQDVMYGLLLECEPIWTWQSKMPQRSAQRVSVPVVSLFHEQTKEAVHEDFTLGESTKLGFTTFLSVSSPIVARNLKRHGTLQGLQDVRVSCKFCGRFLSFTSVWRLHGGAFFSSSDQSCWRCSSLEGMAVCSWVQRWPWFVHHLHDCEPSEGFPGLGCLELGSIQRFLWHLWPLWTRQKWLVLVVELGQAPMSSDISDATCDMEVQIFGQSGWRHSPLDFPEPQVPESWLHSSSTGENQILWAQVGSFVTWIASAYIILCTYIYCMCIYIYISKV